MGCVSHRAAMPIRVTRTNDMLQRPAVAPTFFVTRQKLRRATFHLLPGIRLSHKKCASKGANEPPPFGRLPLAAFALLCVCRQLGSAKFGSFLFLAAVLSKSIELAFCVQFPFLRPPLGPLATLSALAVTYYGETDRADARAAIDCFQIVSCRRATDLVGSQSNLTLFRTLPVCHLGYVPVTTPAYFTVGPVRISEKFFAYVAIAVVSMRLSAFLHPRLSTKPLRTDATDQ